MVCGIMEIKKLKEEKRMKQIGFFDEENRLAKLSKLGDSLEKLNMVIDWEIFRPLINKVFNKQSKGPGGRPHYDYIMMFKILVLQRIYNLSDDQTEFQINDRMSFMRFLGLSISDQVPDAKTIWLYRDTLAKANIMKELFELFEKKLEHENIITKAGTIVDATFVETPNQHIDREDYKKLKEGKVPQEWKENKHKLAQKDTDARYSIKRGHRYYGFKDHIKADAESKMIVAYEVTNAAVHDGQMLPFLVDESDNAIYADSAYWGKPNEKALPANVKNCIHEKGTKKEGLSKAQRKKNQEKSKIRCRVEHIFGFMTGVFRGLTMRSRGIVRANFNIGLTNLVYNMFRYRFLLRNASVCR